MKRKDLTPKERENFEATRRAQMTFYTNEPTPGAAGMQRSRGISARLGERLTAYRYRAEVFSEGSDVLEVIESDNLFEIGTKVQRIADHLRTRVTLRDRQTGRTWTATPGRLEVTTWGRDGR
jgi:hypothetical protein